ncbi:hypothetical protein ACGFNU_03635 [Spirillospora sp. NPDC048911]|uniref:hypothetical protein n=1 Tax=Spirillospora sp. NPDC048911 TaxID=3364527 RepID=UPI00371DE703
MIIFFYGGDQALMIIWCVAAGAGLWHAGSSKGTPMKKLLLVAPAATAAFTIAGMGMAGIAAAQTTQTAVAAACDSPIKAKESMHIRASIGGTSLGLFPKGRTGCLNSRSSGPSYTACGVTGTTYYYITYGSTKGWVVSGCVTKL